MSVPTHPTTPPLPATAYGLLGGANTERGRKLFSTGVGLLLLALGYFGYNAQVYETLHLYQGLVILTLSFVPGLLWAKSGGSRFPVFEPIMLLCASAYAIPLLNGHEQLLQYTPEIITQAGWAVILYQVSAVAAYHLTQGRPGESSFWTVSILGRQVEKFVGYGLVISCLYVADTTFIHWIPAELESVLRAACFGLGILCTFIGCQRWGRGELLESEKAIILCTLVSQMIMQAISLVLVDSLSLLGIAFLGYLSGGKRIPWLTLLAAFFLLTILHHGKGPMRQKHWDEFAPPVTISQVPGFYSEWIGYGLQPTEPTEGARETSNSRKLLERTSLIHILCLVINYSPERQPFLYGETYGYVLPQLIPRFFWPNKPRSHVATYRLATYYGLQDADATNSTTIAFGMLTEAYANFGLVGAALLGIFWGGSLKKLQMLSFHSPMFSLAGLLMILLTAWSFGSEFTMAAWFSSLAQAIMVVLGIPLALRQFFGS